MKVLSDMFRYGLPMQTGVVDARTGHHYSDGILAAEFKLRVARLVHWPWYNRKRVKPMEFRHRKKVRSRDVGRRESLRELFLDGRSCV
jgi:hypothetical protein